MAMRAMVVGCGFIGGSDVVPGSGIQSHAAAWANHPGARLVGLCDTDRQRLATAVARWRPPVAGTDLDRVLAEARPELVSVATPDATHAEIVERVLEEASVRAVLVEKPIAMTSVDGRRLAALAARRGVVLAVNYSRRYAPSHRLLADWLGGEPLGPIEVVRGVYVRGLKHNGTHWIDLARWLVGDVVSVTGDGPVDDAGGDATIDVRLEFAAGARGVLIGVRDAGYSLFELELIGSAGRLVIADGGQRFLISRGVASRRFPGFRDLAPAAGPPGGLADLLMHAASDLIESVATGRPPAGTADDAITALTIAEAALRSGQREGGHVATIGR